MTSAKTNIILVVLAIIAGFALPFPAQHFFGLILPLIAILVFLSARKLNLAAPTKHEFAVTIELFGVSYFVLSAIYVLLGLAIAEPEIQIGIWLIALMPPAMNVIPLSKLLKGDVKESMLAGILSIIVAMLVIPIGSYFFFGTNVVMTSLAKVLILGVIIPAGIGIVCRNVKVLDKPTEWLIPIANAVIFYILIGSNSQLLIDNFNNSYFLAIVGVLLLVKLGFVSWVNMQFAQLQSKKENIDVILFASFKNIGLAAAIAVSAFPDFMPGVLIPIAIESVLFAGQLIFIEYLVSKTVPMLRLNKKRN